MISYGHRSSCAIRWLTLVGVIIQHNGSFSYARIEHCELRSVCLFTDQIIVFILLMRLRLGVSYKLPSMAGVFFDEADSPTEKRSDPTE